MNEPRWTKGPWQVMPINRAQNPWIVGDVEGGSIADFAPIGPWMSDAEARANACLGATAPKLYAALKELVEEIETDGGVDTSEWPRLDAAKAILAEARDER